LGWRKNHPSLQLPISFQSLGLPGAMSQHGADLRDTSRSRGLPSGFVPAVDVHVEMAGRDRPLDPYVNPPVMERPEYEAKQKGFYAPSVGGVGQPRSLPNSAAAPAPNTPAAAEMEEKSAPFSWSHAHMHYLPNIARQEAEDRIRDSQNYADSWRVTSEELEKRADRFEGKMRETEVECMHKVREVNWASEQKAEEYEHRIRELELQMDGEREAHARELQRFAEMLQRERQDCEERVRQTEKRCADQVAAANIRGRDAEEVAESVRRLCDEEIAAVRTREAARVDEARRAAETKTRDVQTKARNELDINHSRMIERQREMEEKLYINTRLCTDAKVEAKRHVRAVEEDMEELRQVREADGARKDSRLAEWTAQQRSQNTAFATHCQGQLDVEKSMHKITCDRTMDRVMRHLQYGDGDYRGRTTPTRSALSEIVASPRAAGSSLARAGFSAIAAEK